MPLFNCAVDDMLVCVFPCRDQRVIDNAVKQWRKRLCACVAANGGQFEHLCECCTTFAVNAYFSCHIN